jgi:hypothetical protein
MDGKAMTPTQFFARHGAYSYDPKAETPDQGRMRCARAMATAEAYARDNGWHTEWTQDGECYAWQGECFDVITDWRRVEGETYHGWWATLYDEHGTAIGSLCGVTFEDDNRLADPHRRVVEAELALEAMPKEAAA